MFGCNFGPTHTQNHDSLKSSSHRQNPPTKQNKSVKQGSAGMARNPVLHRGATEGVNARLGAGSELRAEGSRVGRCPSSTCTQARLLWIVMLMQCSAGRHERLRR